MTTSQTRITRAQIRKETDKLIDEVVKQGNDAGMDPFEIALVNGPFRSFAHLLDDAQAMGLDTKGVGLTIVSHMANLVKAYLERTIPRDQYDAAVVTTNTMFTMLADFTSSDIVNGWHTGKPN